jgi:hypothetical protein
VLALAGIFVLDEQKESTKVRNKSQQMQQADTYTVDIQAVAWRSTPEVERGEQGNCKPKGEKRNVHKICQTVFFQARRLR